MNTNNYGIFNPFVKPGDIILIKHKYKKYRVVEVNENEIKVVPEGEWDLSKAISFKWSEFAGWRSK